MGLSWLMPVDPASVSGTGKVFVIVDGFCKVLIQHYRFSVKIMLCLPRLHLFDQNTIKTVKL